MGGAQAQALSIIPESDFVTGLHYLTPLGSAFDILLSKRSKVMEACRKSPRAKPGQKRNFHFQSKEGLSEHLQIVLMHESL